MEEESKLILKIDRAFYLLKHFSQIDKKARLIFTENNYSKVDVDNALNVIGSKFNFSFCRNPFDLVRMIPSLTPIHHFDQSNGNTIYLFRNEQKNTGNDNLISIDELTLNERSKIKFEVRNDFEVGLLRSSKVNQTKDCVLIVKSETNEIITFFPGIYAPPFPIHLNEGDLKIKAEYFWKNHVFLTQEN
jgi:hypothetical protein